MSWAADVAPDVHKASRRTPDGSGPPTRSTRPLWACARTPGPWLIAAAGLFWVVAMPDYLVFSMASAIPVALVAMGLLILQGWSRELSLASAGLFAVAMYFTGMFDRPEAHGKNWPWPLAALVGIAIAAGLMAVLALCSARLPGIYVIAFTLVLQVLIERVIYPREWLTGGALGGAGQTITNPRPPFFASETSDQAYYVFCSIWLVLVLIAVKRLRHSPAGLAFLLVGADRQAASSVGINPLRFRVMAFVISGALAGMGGVLTCWLLVSAAPTLAYMAPQSLFFLAIPVLAGMDSIAFVLIMAAAFQVIPVVLQSWHINVFVLAGVGLAGGAFAGPRGAGGRASDLWKRFKFGDRRSRTARERVETTTMRSAEGLAGDPQTVSSLELQDALQTVEDWLPPRPEGDVAVQASGIKVTMGAVHALDGASIVVPAGQMVGLIGPNGAGKTTLFDVISGIRMPDEGQVQLFGRDVIGVSAWDRAKLGMVRTFQTTRVITELTVADNLLSGAHGRIGHGTLSFILGRRAAWDELAVAEDAAWAIARLLDVDRYWNERVSSLEFSARRRVEIGRAILAGPRLLLLDEPAAGLDPASSAALFTLIRQLHTDLGLTVLLVEHYVKAVLDTCDLVYVLAQGTVLASGTPSEIAEHPEVREHYLGTRLSFLDKMSGAAADASLYRRAPEGSDGNGSAPEASARAPYPAPIRYPPLRRD
jgi:ABC-type branched-subunit amino acid transport system ATPase component/ABC-type branched-subunit amino acid transport system permease subunit